MVQPDDNDMKQLFSSIVFYCFQIFSTFKFWLPCLGLGFVIPEHLIIFICFLFHSKSCKLQYFFFLIGRKSAFQFKIRNWFNTRFEQEQNEIKINNKAARVLGQNPECSDCSSRRLHFFVQKIDYKNQMKKNS